jgi:hypothetical protein
LLNQHTPVRKAIPRSSCNVDPVLSERNRSIVVKSTDQSHRNCKIWLRSLRTTMRMSVVQAVPDGRVPASKWSIKVDLEKNVSPQLVPGIEKSWACRRKSSGGGIRLLSLRKSQRHDTHKQRFWQWFFYCPVLFLKILFAFGDMRLPGASNAELSRTVRQRVQNS